MVATGLNSIDGVPVIAPVIAAEPSKLFPHKLLAVASLVAVAALPVQALAVVAVVAVAALPVQEPELPEQFPVTLPVRGPENPDAEITLVLGLTFTDLAKIPVLAP